MGQPDSLGLSWVGLLGGFEFFSTRPWWVGLKNTLNLTQPNPCTSLFARMVVLDETKGNTNRIVGS